MEPGRASWTARWVATQRVRLHEQRPSAGDATAELRLYQDLEIPLLKMRMAGPTGMVARTRFIDDELVRAVDRGVRQVVLVGAGYDGRAMRFSGLRVRWIEVDHPATQADKLQRLARIGAATEHVSFVPVDLLRDDLGAELDKAGHDPALPSFWVCEGLFPYLPRPAISALCATLRARSSPGSALVCNVVVDGAPRSLTRPVRKAVDGLLAAIGERRLSSFGPGDSERILADAGWAVQRQESTSPGRADGTYLVAIMAVAE